MRFLDTISKNSELPFCHILIQELMPGEMSVAKISEFQKQPMEDKASLFLYKKYFMGQNKSFSLNLIRNMFQIFFLLLFLTTLCQTQVSIFKQASPQFSTVVCNLDFKMMTLNLLIACMFLQHRACVQFSVVKYFCMEISCNFWDRKPWMSYLYQSLSQGIGQCKKSKHGLETFLLACKCIFLDPPSQKFIKDVSYESTIKSNRQLEFKCPKHAMRKKSVFGIMSMPCDFSNSKLYSRIPKEFSISVFKTFTNFSLDVRLKLNLTILVLLVGNPRVHLDVPCKIQKNTYRLDVEPFHFRNNFASCNKLSLTGRRNLLTLLSDKN